MCGVGGLLLGLPLTISAEGDEPTVVINEVMWMGSTDEWIELRNMTGEEIDLAGWTLEGATSGTPGILTISGIIPAEGYFLIVRKTNDETAISDAVAADMISSLSFLDSGEVLMLYNGDEEPTLIDQTPAIVAKKWAAGDKSDAAYQSMQRKDPPGDGVEAENWYTCTDVVQCTSDTFWKLADGNNSGTPGAANSEPAPTPTPVVNNPPTATITGPNSALVKTAVLFRTADAADPDDDPLTLVWNFGDGSSGSGEEVEYTYTAAGKFTVTLTVSDGEFEPEITHEITVTKPAYADTIRINEFLVNPTGSDITTEFIELINTGADEVNLAGWKLDDVDGGSAAYTIPEPTTLAAGSINSFSRSVTKIALNNTGDTVRLLNPDGVIKHSYTYTGAVAEGQSHNRKDDKFILSTTPTPGKANVITAPDEDDEDEADDEDETPTPTPTGGGVGGANIVALPLANIRTARSGQVITTTGTISAPPGVLGQNTLYLAGSGIQVYFSKGTWPILALGDVVSITGTLTSSLGESRLKIAAVTDVVKQKTGMPPVPHQVDTGVIDEAMEGTLVEIQGKVIQTSGATFYVDDGSGPIKVFIKTETGIQKPRMRQGDSATIIGVVSQTTAGYRILPRFQSDVTVVGASAVVGLTKVPKTGMAASDADFRPAVVLGASNTVQPASASWRMADRPDAGIANNVTAASWLSKWPWLHPSKGEMATGSVLLLGIASVILVTAYRAGEPLIFSP